MSSPTEYGTSRSAMAEWQALKRGMSKASFMAKFAHPFLLRRRLSRTVRVSKELDDDWAERVAFDTRVVAPEDLAIKPEKMKGTRVVPLVKAEGNPFPERISVGRATNCDIVVRDSSVSKLHAHMRILGPGAAEITDVKSRNGTRVNGKEVAPMVAVRLRSGDSVVLGSVVLQFLDPQALYDVL
jgi:hypothetical protein